MMSTMTRNYHYGSEYGDMDRYRNYHHQPVHYYDDRSVPLHLQSYADRQPMRSAPAGRPARLLQDTSDQDQPSNNSTRRRIAVACARCRKRKIKCSGDPGNGFGCQNCRTAGVESCNFFRVGAHDVPGFPQSHAQSNALANYMSAPNADRMQYLNAQQTGYGYQQAHQPLSIATTSLQYYAGDGQQYETESPSDNYVLSPTNTMPPPHDPYARGYGMHENNRMWSNPINQNRYQMPSYTRYEQDPSSSYGYGAYNSTRRPAMSDGSGAFNISSLSNSLPNPPTERLVLPLPNAGGRQQYQASYDMMPIRTSSSNFMGGSSTMAAAAFGKNAPNWMAEQQATSGARNNSIASSRSSDIAAPVPQKPSTASSTSSDATSLAYISSSASPDISPTTTSASDHIPRHTDTTDHHGIPSNNLHQSNTTQHHESSHAQSEHSMYSLPSGAASDTRLGQSSGTSGMYTFSIARRPTTNNEPSTTDNALVNGLPYTSIPPLVEQHGRVAAIPSFRHETPSSGANTLHHRSSMPIMGHDS